MRALTLWEPWATAIAFELKQFETRSWGTKYRGTLAIHAGKKVDADQLAWARSAYPRFPEPRPGEILCVVELIDCRPMLVAPDNREAAWGYFGERRFGWELGFMKPLPAGVQATGHQGLWTPPTEVAEQLAGALA